MAGLTERNLLCSGIAENDEVVAVGNILEKIWVALYESVAFSFLKLKIDFKSIIESEMLVIIDSEV